jgi:hypothetical protein
VALKEGKVPMIDFEERTYTFEGGKGPVAGAHGGGTAGGVRGLNLGRRGLLNLIQDQREIIIQEFE